VNRQPPGTIDVPVRMSIELAEQLRSQGGSPPVVPMRLVDVGMAFELVVRSAETERDEQIRRELEEIRDRCAGYLDTKNPGGLARTLHPHVVAALALLSGSKQP